VAGYEIKRDSSLAIAGAAIEVAPEGIAVRKGDAAVLNPLKAAFKALQDDGTYKGLLTKWGVTDGDIANNKS
jgi:polar amino acid transport system substrate-binding protein